MAEAARTKITEIATIVVPVTDQDRALAFYVDTLGWEKRMDMSYGDNRWVEVAPTVDATTTVALAPGAEGREPGIDTGLRLSTDDATADHASLHAAGVKVDELLNWEGVPPMFYASDPDGNRFVVVERPPRA